MLGAKPTIMAIALLVAIGRVNAALDCTTVFGADETPAVNNGVECPCLAGHQWSATYSVCEVDCYGLAHTSATASATYSTNYTCACEANFFFNPYLPGCVINCSGFTGSLGINVDTETCLCRNPYIWAVSPSRSCQIDCALVSYGDGTPSADNKNCTCIAGFKWDPLNMECRIACTGVANSLGAPASKTSCKCRQGTLWSAAKMACVVSCASILNTNGAAAVNDACTCTTSSYTWDPTTLTCAYTCS